MKNLVIIPGITSKMGSAFSERFKEIKNYEVIGFTTTLENEKPNIRNANMLDKNSISKSFKNIKFKDYKEIFLIHSIGPFLFEANADINNLDNEDEFSIDTKTYNLNFLTFKNIFEELFINIDLNKQDLILVAFGSISDKYNIPWWRSYSRSKIFLKNYIRDKVNEKIRGIFINVSSTEKDEERLFANKKYWMSCQEVSRRTFRAVLDNNINWQEIDIFKPNPEFHKMYFLDHEYIKKKWIQDMYGKDIN